MSSGAVNNLSQNLWPKVVIGIDRLTDFNRHLSVCKIENKMHVNIQIFNYLCQNLLPAKVERLTSVSNPARNTSAIYRVAKE